MVFAAARGPQGGSGVTRSADPLCRHRLARGRVRRRSSIRVLRCHWPARGPGSSFVVVCRLDQQPS